MAKVATKPKTFVDVLFEKRRGMVRLENAGAASLRRQMRTIKRESLNLIERNMARFRRTGTYIDSPSALAMAERTATEMDILLQQRLVGPTGDVIRLRQTAWDQGVQDLKGASRRLPQGIQSSMDASFGQVNLQAAIAARTNPVFGVNPRTAFNGIRGHTSQKVQELLSSAVLSSASVKDTARQLADAMDLNIDAAQRIVRTNMNAAYNEAQRSIYNANPEIFIGYKWEAVFDDRTSIVCLELHGSFYPLGTVPPGPPAHWNCRSILVGVFRDEEIEALADTNERRVREFKERPDGTFKSTTKLVPTYLPSDVWLKSQPFGVVQSVTGSRLKAELFLRGTANLDDIVTPALGVRNNRDFMKRIAALHPKNRRFRKMARELGVKRIPSKASIARSDASIVGKQPFDRPMAAPGTKPGPGTFLPDEDLVGLSAREGELITDLRDDIEGLRFQYGTASVKKRKQILKQIEEKTRKIEILQRKSASATKIRPPKARVTPPKPKAKPKRKPKPKPKRKAKPKPKPEIEVTKQYKNEADWLRSLTSSEEKALEVWVEGDYRSIRSAIAGKKVSLGVRKLADDFNKALLRAPRHKGTTWRGLKDIDERRFRKLSTVSEITTETVASSSTEQSLAEQFVFGAKTERNVMLRFVDQTEGVRIPFEFGMMAEDEIVIPKGVAYRVVARRWRTISFTNTHYLEISLEEVR